MIGLLMKKLLLLQLIIPFCIHAEIYNKPQDASAVNISPTFTPVYYNNPNIAPQYNIENKPQFITYVSSLSYSVGMKIRDITIDLVDQIHKNATPENFTLIKQLIKEMLWYYRYRIISSTAIGSYSATSALLLTDYHYFSNSTAWSRWKQECTFEDLCAISQKDLARELLLTIGQRYYNEQNPTDLAHPLIEFLNDINTEIKKIKRYISIANIVKRLHLIKIFPTNEPKIGYAHKRLERVLFIKHIFLSWLSEYNLTNSYKK